jgi:hypothetical protein
MFVEIRIIDYAKLRKSERRWRLTRHLSFLRRWNASATLRATS